MQIFILNSGGAQIRRHNSERSDYEVMIKINKAYDFNYYNFFNYYNYR